MHTPVTFSLNRLLAWLGAVLLVAVTGFAVGEYVAPYTEQIAQSGRAVALGSGKALQQAIRAARERRSHHARGQSRGEHGGYKEIIASVNGRRLRWASWMRSRPE